MSRGRVAAVVRRLFRQFRRDRRTLALLFVAPLLILTLFDLLLRGGTQRAAMAVVNLDRGPLGAAVASRLLSSTLVEARAAGAEPAESDLRAGRIAAYVLFPPSFTEEASVRRSIAPELHLEGSQPALSQAAATALGQALAGALTDQSAQGPRVQVRATYLHGGAGLDTLDYLAAAFIGLIVFFLVFLITIVSFLRERSQGTLERLMSSPLRRPELVAGYMIAFTVLALVQSVEVLLFALNVLRVHSAGSALLVFAIEMVMALGAVNLGIFLSMFARTEFQAVQFIPLVVVPQVLLCGVIVPLASEPGWLQAVSRALPLTYGVDGLRQVMLRGMDLRAGEVQVDLAVLLLFCAATVAGAAAALRRRVA